MSTDDRDSIPLTTPERIFCAIIGIAAGGAGGYASFERSNQLGSAVLLVIGAVFLLIGIQGTRLIRLASGPGSLELERNQKLADEIIKEKEAGNIEKAAGMAQGAAIVNPGLSGVRPEIQYELQVASALIGMGYQVGQLMHDQGFDLIISDDERKAVYAELKYYRRQVSLRQAETLTGRASTTQIPVIFITYSEPTGEAQELIDSIQNVEIAQWRNEGDNGQLSEKLRRLFSLQIPSNE